MKNIFYILLLGVLMGTVFMPFSAYAQTVVTPKPKDGPTDGGGGVTASSGIISIPGGGGATPSSGGGNTPSSGGATPSSGGGGTSSSGGSSSPVGDSDPDFGDVEGGASSTADAAAQGPCTSSKAFDVDISGTGIITEVVDHIQTVVNNTSQVMYEAINANPSFKMAFGGSLVLFVTLYGVGALMGVIQISLKDGFTRLMKFGFVVLLVTNWTFFSENVMVFFNKGTDDIINRMTAVAIGVPVGTGAGPLVVLDGVISLGFGVKMVITLIALLFNWPWGPLFLVLIFWGLFTAFNTVFSAVWIYLMSLIAKALLFGLAPIFITCLLFQRTRHLFEGWLSQLISYSLQPIFLFAFIGFYMVLIEASLREILHIQLCYRPITSLWDALPNMVQQWQFVDDSGNVYKDQWGNAAQYPIQVVPVLIFILLAQLAYRHTQIIQVLAREISGSIISLADLRPGIVDSAGNLQDRLEEAAKSGAGGHSDGGGGRGVGGTKGAAESVSRAGGPQA